MDKVSEEKEGGGTDKWIRASKESQVKRRCVERGAVGRKWEERRRERRRSVRTERKE